MVKRFVLKIFFLSLCIFLVTRSGSASILIIAPHPDDETLMFAGVIYRALSRGEEVRIVIVTNGDFRGISEGYERLGESVNAMDVLGIVENEIIFLGYPDGDRGLETIYYNYTSPDDVYVSRHGQSETYGNRGLGGSDYHTYAFGIPGKYNKPNILMDLESILSDFLPDHIFVTSEFDTHSDHSAAYLYVRDALFNISGLYPNYRPVVHSTLIHGGDDSRWPETADPETLFTPPLNMGSIPFDWDLRESINVPPIMQSTDLNGENVKYIATTKYVTQFFRGGNLFLTHFVHKDEFFFAENILGSNTPPMVEAGNDQSLDAGVLVTLDGSGSIDPDGDPLSYSWSQAEGVPVILSDPASSTPTFFAPTGLTDDETLEFELRVDDGEFESIPDAVAVYVSKIDVVPDSAVSPQSGDFGNVELFASSSPQTFTVTNTGTANLLIGTLTLTGADATEFSIENDMVSGQTIEPSGNGTFDVVLTPNSKGAKNGAVVIHSNVPDSPQMISLGGTGVASDIYVSPTSHDFGSVEVFFSSSPQIFTVTNVGTADLNINKILITGPAAVEFTIINDAASGQNIRPSESRTFEVIFAPIASVSKTATITIESNDPDMPTGNWAITGTGTAPTGGGGCQIIDRSMGSDYAASGWYLVWLMPWFIFKLRKRII